MTGMSYYVKAKENVSALVEIFNAIPSPPFSAPAKLRPINSLNVKQRTIPSILFLLEKSAKF